MIRQRIHHFEVFPIFYLSWIIQTYYDYLDLPIHIRGPQLRSKDIFYESYPLQSNIFGINCWCHEWLLPRIRPVVCWFPPSGFLDSVRKYFDIEPGLEYTMLGEAALHSKVETISHPNISWSFP